MLATNKNIMQALPILKKHIQAKMPIKIDLASGQRRRSDWITIDMRYDADIVGDITEIGIPFPDDSADIVHCSHFLEHLYFPTPMRDILLECKRVLKKNGIFSVCVPDASVFIRAYLKGEDGLFQEHELDLPNFHYNTPIDYINYIAFMGMWKGTWGHKHLFDSDNLIKILENIGFSKVTLREYDEELDHPDFKNHHKQCSTRNIFAICLK